MRFLIILQPKEIPPLPPEKFLELVVAEWETVVQYKKEGKAEVAYAFAGLKGGMGIYDAKSGAELNAFLARLPLYSWLDIQIFPLMEAEEVLAQTKHRLEAYRAKR
ncbi:MAG: muconolactone Delta-isomerase family protein [Promethearchaeota archaeon]